MHNVKNNILIVVAILVLGVLFAFTNHRNSKRKTIADNIIFTTSNNLFISEDSVNKLLIQKSISSPISTKETLALNTIETRLKNIPHVKEAQVYVSVNGLINAEITPRKAIGRMYSSDPRYIDEQGFEMPLSNHYAERVPLVFNYKSKSKKQLVTILQKIEANTFFKQLVVGVYCQKNETFRLKIRDYNGNIELGNIEDLDKKLANFKVFYAKAVKDELFKKYKKINLQITNQVVCTK